MGKSNLDLVNECDNFPYRDHSPQVYDHKLSGYFEFRLQGYDCVLGYMLPDVAAKIASSDHWKLDTTTKTLTFCPKGEHGPASSLQDRNVILAQELERLRKEKAFRVLEGWRSEEYPIHGPSREFILSMERSCTPLFGVVTYGVHMTGFVRSGGTLKIWAPKRALTKQTYPGMMDNTVAGGLSTGEEPMKCLIRECEEEASLPEHIAQMAKSAGTLTYFHVRDSRAGGETGLCQPECQYIYDLELPLDVIPKPNDDEAVDFQLLSVKQVIQALSEGKFKPNCALLLVEFLIRHGQITPESEPDYIEIVARLHRRLEFPTR